MQVRKAIMMIYILRPKANRMYRLLQKVTITQDFIMDILIDTRNKQQNPQIMKATHLQISNKKYFLMNSQEKCSDNKIRRGEKPI